MHVLKYLALASALLISACAGTATTRSTGQQIDDAAITSQVKARFAESAEVDAMDINVTTYRGVVQLSGFADSQRQIDQAVVLARKVEGVQDVQNGIRLKASTG